MEKHPFSEESILTTAFFTGHRYLPAEESRRIQEKLFECLSYAYSKGYRRFFCGCALGFDTIAALQTLRLRQLYPDVILSLAIPCETQSAKWQEKDKRIYAQILEQADEKTVLSPRYYQGVMLTRNRYMADRSSLCISYLSHMRGGTAYTVRYALQNSRMNIVNLAVEQDFRTDLMREKAWNYIFTYPSAVKNAATAPFRLLSEKKLILKHM